MASLTETGHTPGPWLIGNRQAATGHEVYHPLPSETDFERSRVVVASICYSKADARLIAAAPDLLAALEEFIRIDDEDGTGLLCEAGSDLMLAVDAAKLALAKARGK